MRKVISVKIDCFVIVDMFQFYALVSGCLLGVGVYVFCQRGYGVICILLEGYIF